MARVRRTRRTVGILRGAGDPRIGGVPLRDAALPTAAVEPAGATGACPEHTLGWQAGTAKLRSLSRALHQYYLLDRHKRAIRWSSAPRLLPERRRIGLRPQEGEAAAIPTHLPGSLGSPADNLSGFAAAQAVDVTRRQVRPLLACFSCASQNALHAQKQLDNVAQHRLVKPFCQVLRGVGGDRPIL